MGNRNGNLLFGLLMALAWAGTAAGAAGTVDVTDFGAIGDGRADSTAAFEQAIDRAARTGAAVHVPPGRFVISDHLDLDGPVQIVGSGHRASIITANGERARLLIRSSDTTIRDLGFERMVEPIALTSRADYVLENIRIERCRFEQITVQARNTGVIGLSSGRSGQRPHRIRYLLVRDCIFRAIDAHAINIRGNISEAQILDNQFLEIVSSREEGERPMGGVAIRLGESSDDAGLLEVFAEQGRHRIAGNVIRQMRKRTRGGNLIGLLVYGNYNVIRDNLIEDIDGTAEGLDTNAMYLRGSYNRVVGNTIRDIRGADDDGALCFKGGLDQGNQHNLVAHNTIQDVRGMSAVEASSSHLQFTGNTVVDAPVRGFYHRTGENLWVQDNTFVNADAAIRTSRGEVLVAGNRFINCRITLSQRRPQHLQSHRNAVYIHANVFRNSSPGPRQRMIRMANNVHERFVSIRDNRLHNLVEQSEDEAGGGRLVDLVSSATVEEAEVIGNHVVQQGPEEALFRIGGAAGAGRFADNMIVVRDLRGPVLISAFTVIEGNTIRIAGDAVAGLSIAELFVAGGYASDADLVVRHNRIDAGGDGARIGAVTRWRDPLDERGTIVFDGNLLSGAIESLGRFDAEPGGRVVLTGNRLPFAPEDALIGLPAETPTDEEP